MQNLAELHSFRSEVGRIGQCFNSADDRFNGMKIAHNSSPHDTSKSRNRVLGRARQLLAALAQQLEAGLHDVDVGDVVGNAGDDTGQGRLRLASEPAL